MDTAAQWPQGIGLGNYKKLAEAEAEAAGTAKPILENINSDNNNSDNRSSSSSRSEQIKNHQPLNCPRCTSTNTKFCYYNNYSLSQPRYFCKTCRRYWTEGGSLRNVPVGGGSRKTKRFSSSSPSVSSKNNNINPPPPDHHHQINPRIHFDQTIPHDLNLTYPQPIITHHQHDYNHRPYDDDHHQHHQVQNPNTSSTNTAAANDRIFPPPSRGFFSSLFMPTVTGSGLDIVSDPTTIYTSGFNIPLQEFKPSTLNFSLDGDGSSAFGSSRVENERILFPGAEDVNNNKSSSTAPSATTTSNSNNNNNNSNSNNNIY